MALPLVGVLALQGAFREHLRALAVLGAAAREIRQLKDLDQPSSIEALIIPGGESSTMGKLLVDLGLLEPIRQRILAGMPVYGTCAGLILLCREIENSSQPRIAVLNARVRRNAFGRQVDSFEAALTMPVLGSEPIPAVFIRAPIILDTDPGVEILASYPLDGEERPVAVRQGQILATAFHPELTPDTRLHRYFLDFCRQA